MQAVGIRSAETGVFVYERRCFGGVLGQLNTLKFYTLGGEDEIMKDKELCHRITLQKRIQKLRDLGVDIPENCTAHEAKRLLKIALTVNAYCNQLMYPIWGLNAYSFQMEPVRQLFASRPDLLRRIFKLMKEDTKELPHDDDYHLIKQVVEEIVAKYRAEHPYIFDSEKKTFWEKFLFIFGIE